MEYVILNNGVKMPLVGIGTFPYKGEELKEVLQICYDAGYRLIDTAWLYQNEVEIGDFLKANKIQDVFVTSKLHFDQIYWYYNQHLRIGIRKSSIRRAYLGSQKRLGLSQIDLYLLHAPFKNFKYLYTAITKLYTEGMIKAVGVSNFSINNLEQLKECSDIVPAVNQIEMNPFNSNRSLIDYCKSRGIVVEAFSPFGRGLLTKEIMDEPKLKELSRKYDKSVAQVILRWLTQQGIVAIPRSNKVEKIRQNISIFDFNLTDAEIDEIYGINKNIRTVGGKIRVGHD